MHTTLFYPLKCSVQNTWFAPQEPISNLKAPFLFSSPWRQNCLSQSECTDRDVASSSTRTYALPLAMWACAQVGAKLVLGAVLPHSASDRHTLTTGRFLCSPWQTHFFLWFAPRPGTGRAPTLWAASSKSMCTAVSPWKWCSIVFIFGL